LADACCRLILFEIAHAVAPCRLPIELDALGTRYARPVVDKLRGLFFHSVRWNFERRRERAIIVINREVRWNSCPARNPLTFFLFLNFYLERPFFPYYTRRFHRISGGFRWMSGGICGQTLPPFTLTVPCTALVDSRSVHRTYGGNGPRRHRLFECRDCADNQFHRNSLAVHFRNHVCNRGVQTAIPKETM
jgi:hypothetical protein